VAWSELKLGVVGVIALVLATLMVLAIGGESGFWTNKYPLKVRFDDVMGIKPGAVVRLGGKDVGKVTAVDFAGAEIDVSLEVLSSVQPLITTNSTAAIGSVSLLGEPNIEVRPSTTGAPLGEWDYITSAGAAGMFSEITATAEDSLEQVAGLLTDIRAGEGTLGKLVTDDSLYRELDAFVNSAAQVTQAMNRGEGTLGQLLRDPAAANALKASLDNLQTMTARINSGEGALGRFLNDEALGNSLSGTIANLEEVTGRMSRGEGTMAKLINDPAVHDRLDGLLARMDKVIAGLEAGEGTAGQLLQDRQLYENINGAVTELQSLLADIRADPRRFLRVSVSIF
jgi:phospholipid/cholesterol/gamma-HCH transport system substrate-binding protein